MMLRLQRNHPCDIFDEACEICTENRLFTGKRHGKCNQDGADVITGQEVRNRAGPHRPCEYARKSFLSIT